MTQKNENLMALMIMNTIGLSIIYAEFNHAYWAYSNPNWRSKLSSDSLAFIEGTGLDLVLAAYHLMYDANHLRNVFFSMVGDHSKIVHNEDKRTSFEAHHRHPYMLPETTDKEKMYEEEL